MKTVKRRRGIAFVLALLLVLQAVCRGEYVQAIADKNNTYEAVDQYCFYVSEKLELEESEKPIPIAGAEVQVIVSERINTVSPGDGSISPEDGKISPEEGMVSPMDAFLIPGTVLGTGITDREGRVGISVPKGIKSQFCEYTITKEGYHTLEKMTMEDAAPEKEIKASLAWIPVFERTEVQKITWKAEGYKNVLVDSQGNEILRASYSIVKAEDNNHKVLEKDEIEKYVVIDPNTGEIIPQDLQKLYQEAESSEGGFPELPLTLTVQAQKPYSEGLAVETAEYELELGKAEDIVTWEPFAEDILVRGTEHVILKAQSAGGQAVNYRLLDGEDIVKVGPKDGSITYQHPHTGKIAAKAYTTESSLYQPAENEYHFSVVNMKIDVNDLKLNGFQYDQDGKLKEVSIDYGTYKENPSWFVRNQLNVTMPGFEFDDVSEKQEQWKDCYYLTQVTPSDGNVDAEFSMKEIETGKRTGLVKAENIQWDNQKPHALKISYLEEEIGNNFVAKVFGKIRKYFTKQKVIVELSATDTESGVSRMVWELGDREIVLTEEEIKTDPKTGISTGRFEVKEEELKEQEWNLNFTVWDKAGNHEDYKEEQEGIVWDTKAPTIEISPKEEKTYYKDPREVTIKVTETYFAAEKICASLTAYDGNLKELPQTIVQIGGKSVAAEDLAAELQKQETWHSVGSVHTVKIVYDAEANYEFEIQAEDIAGNKSQKQKETFWIDKTPPTEPQFTYQSKAKIYDVKEEGINKKYCSGDVVVTIKTQDALSGVERLEWREDTDSEWKKINFAVEESMVTGSFTLSTEGERSIHIRVLDKAGNLTEHSDSENRVIIDKTDPKLSVSYETEQAANGNYYKQTRKATISVKEKYFDVKSITAKIQLKDAAGNSLSEQAEIKVAGKMVKAADVPRELQKDENWTVSGDTHSIKIEYSADAKYQVWIQVQDLAGNKSNEYQENFWVDQTEPAEPQIVYSEQKTASQNQSKENYYNKNVIVTIQTEDNLSGIDHVEWREDDNSNWNAAKCETQGTAATARFTLDAEGSRNISVRIYDKAGNCTEHTDDEHQVIIDWTDPVLSVSYDEEQALNGNYYKKERTAAITVQEEHFNAAGITAGLQVKDAFGKSLSKETEIKVSGKTIKAADLSVELQKNENWKVSGDTHTITIVYFEDAAYEIWIQAEDLAGNKSKRYTETFWLDQTKPKQPVIKYNKEQNQVSEDGTNKNYYNSNVYVSIMAEDGLSGIDHIEWRDHKESDWETVDFTAEGITAAAKITLDTEGQRNISVRVYDKAGNCIEYTDNENQIIIDKTDPVLSVSYGREQVWKEGYYARTRIATITVEEEHFDAKDITASLLLQDAEGTLLAEETEVLINGKKVTAAKALGELQKNENWSASGNTHATTIVYSQDAKYDIEIQARDLATNQSQEYTETFCLDQTKAQQPVITYSDAQNQVEEKTIKKYYSKDVTVSVTVEDKLSGIDRMEWRENSGSDWNPLEFKAEGNSAAASFTLKKEGQRNISVRIYDKAGNLTEYTDKGNQIIIDQTKPVLSVTYGKQQAENGNYYRSARTAVITVKEQHFDAADITAEIQLKDAAGNSLTEKEIFVAGKKVTAADALSELRENNNWITSGDVHKIILAYAEDAAYEVSIQAKDLAINKSKKYTEKFWIDQTEPKQPAITYSKEKNLVKGKKANKKYYSGNVSVEIKADDSMAGVDYMEWSVDGKKSWTKIAQKDLEITGNAAKAKNLKLDQEGPKQIVAVRIYDKAGNCKEFTDSENQIFIDRTNPAVRISYQEQQVKYDKYYDKPRTATISIEEKNFDASYVTVKAKAEDVSGTEISDKIKVLVGKKSIKIKDLSAVLKKRGNWEYNKKEKVYQTTIQFSKDADYQFSIETKDLALRTSNKEKHNFCIDQTCPQELAISYSEPVLEKILEKVTFGYYKSHVIVNFSAKDHTAGIDTLSWSYIREQGVSEQNISKQEGEVKQSELTFFKDRSQASYQIKLTAKEAEQYRGNLKFTVTDKSGNPKTYRDQENRIVVDSISPVMEVSYVPVNTSGNKVYFDQQAVLKFKMTEANFYKKDVEVKINGEQASIEDWKRQAGTDQWNGSLTLKEDGDYTVTVTYQDRSGNGMKASDESNSNSQKKTWTSPILVVDTQRPQIQVSYDNVNPIYSEDGNDYFDRTRTATIYITDKNFRADEVEAKVTAVRADETPVSVRDYTAQLKQAANWKKNGDTYTANLVYDVDASYTFDISYEDMAHNQASTYAADHFTIDTTVPDNLQISYSDSVLETVLENMTFGFYQARMTVKITAEDDVAGIHHFIYSYKNAENVSGVNSQMLEQQIEKAQITYSNGKRLATAEFTIPQSELDQNNQFNGIVEFDAVDNSNHQTKLTDTRRIVVDTIAPTAEVTYSAPTASANGIDYYDQAVEGQIAITEANFQAEDVQVTATKNGAPYMINVSWSDQSADLHHGSFQFNEDGDYQVSITYQDKSGNVMAEYQSNQLTVDSTAPVVTIAEIADQTAYNQDTIGFKVSVDDENFDLSSFQPSLTGIVRQENGTFITKDFSELGRIEAVESGKHYEYVIDNITEDAIYTLSCAVEDLSLNATSEMNVIENSNSAMDSIMFSVNRNGSTFMLSESTQELVDNYYVQEVGEAVVLKEVNCDPVVQHKIMVNGSGIRENSQYHVQDKQGKNTWYQYDYVIDKEVFEAEGDYMVVISTTDQADNLAYSDIKNVEASFVVDRTPPVVTVSGLADNGKYQVETQNVNVIPTDDGGNLKSLNISIYDRADKLLKQAVSLEEGQFSRSLEENGGMLQFEIPQGMGQKISVLCQDAAGNVYQKIYKNITVSTDWYVMFVTSKPFLYTGTGAAVVTISTVGITLRRRKKRKNKNINH